MEFWAEHDCDRYVRENFFPDYSYTGLLIEVGAGPVDFYSFSKHFRNHNWRCIGFDPNPKFYEAHKNAGHEIYQLALADYKGVSSFTIVDTGHWGDNLEGISYSALSVRYPCPHENKTNINVNVDTLDNMLETLDISKIDILTIDTEGWELDVMKGLNTKKYRPNLIVLENFLFTNTYDQYMYSIGYKKIQEISHNFFYVSI